MCVYVSKFYYSVVMSFGIRGLKEIGLGLNLKRKNI